MFNHYKRIRTICNPQDVGPLFDEKKKKLKSKLFSMFTKYIYMQDFKHFDRIVALSKDDEKAMRHFIPEEKIVQICNPIDMEPQYVNKSEHKEKIIAALNLVYEHKNCITLVKAFEKIQDKIPHNLVIMGRINEKSYQYAKEHDLLERIIFTGVVTDEERDRILCSCEMYVSPTTFEGFGMTNVEAVFKGAITLLSDLPVNREVVGDAAVYYEPVLDKNALANKILEVLQNDEYKLTVEKQKALVWKYSCKNIAEQYLELLMPQ